MTGNGSSTWMLFASGNSVEVHANSYEAPAGSKRPVDAYVVSDCDGDCEEAAARAVETVWQAVSVQGKRLKPMVFGFDLPGRKSRKKVVGASGGLAFVVSAMQKFTECDFGPVAATGILQSTDLDAPLLEVKGIEGKLCAALELIPAGGLVFYPVGNESEVSQELKNSFLEKKIHLFPVRDVSQTLEYLVAGVEKSETKERSLPKWVIGSACCLLLALVVSAGYYFSNSSQTAQGRVELQSDETDSTSEPQESLTGKTEKQANQPSIQDDGKEQVQNGIEQHGNNENQGNSDSDGAEVTDIADQPDSEDIDPDVEINESAEPAEQADDQITGNVPSEEGSDVNESSDPYAKDFNEKIDSSKGFD